MVLGSKYNAGFSHFSLIWFLNPAESQFGSSMGAMIKRVPAFFARDGNSAIISG